MVVIMVTCQQGQGQGQRSNIRTFDKAVIGCPVTGSRGRRFTASDWLIQKKGGVWPSMHLSLRWGGGGCHGDMSTEKISLRTPPRQLRMRLLHNTELYRVNSDYPSAQALRYQNPTISVLCLLYMCMHRTKKEHQYLHS